MAEFSYMRAYELTYSPRDEQDYIIRQKGGEVGLAINFNIQKSKEESANQATIEIFNPGTTTVATLAKEGILTLKAGYKGEPNDDIAVIFVGTIEKSRFRTEGTTKTLTLELKEGVGSFAQTQITQNLGPNLSTQDMVQVLVNHIIANIPSVDSANPFTIDTPIFYVKPQSFFGNAFSYLSEILKSVGYFWFINKGVLTILPEQGVVRDLAVELNSQNGLIGTPKPVTRTDSKKDNVNGVEVESILNYNFDIGRVLLLNTKDYDNSRFRIDSVSFVGNSFEGDWRCTMRAFEVRGTG